MIDYYRLQPSSTWPGTFEHDMTLTNGQRAGGGWITCVKATLRGKNNQGDKPPPPPSLYPLYRHINEQIVARNGGRGEKERERGGGTKQINK